MYILLINASAKNINNIKYKSNIALYQGFPRQELQVVGDGRRAGMNDCYRLQVTGEERTNKRPQSNKSLALLLVISTKKHPSLSCYQQFSVLILLVYRYTLCFTVIQYSMEIILDFFFWFYMSTDFFFLRTANCLPNKRSFGQLVTISQIYNGFTILFSLPQKNPLQRV